MQISSNRLKIIIKEELDKVIKEENIEEGKLEDISLAAFLAMGVGLGAWTIAELTSPQEHPRLKQYEGDIDDSVILDVKQRLGEEPQ